MRPDEALDAARAAAAQMRAQGAYADAMATAAGPPRAEAVIRRLSEWAVIEPDRSDVRSIRRWGQPITLFKRLLLRLLWQYHARWQADQSRFNLLMLSYVEILESRVAELERQLDDE